MASSFQNDPAHSFWHSDIGKSVAKAIENGGGGKSVNKVYDIEWFVKRYVNEQTIRGSYVTVFSRSPEDFSSNAALMVIVDGIAHSATQDKNDNRVYTYDDVRITLTEDPETGMPEIRFKGLSAGTVVSIETYPIAIVIPKTGLYIKRFSATSDNSADLLISDECDYIVFNAELSLGSDAESGSRVVDRAMVRRFRLSDEFVKEVGTNVFIELDWIGWAAAAKMLSRVDFGEYDTLFDKLVEKNLSVAETGAPVFLSLAL